MAAPRLLSQQGRVRDQPCSLDHVGLFRRTFGQSRLDLVELRQSKPQTFGTAIDTAVIPHYLPDTVRRYLGGSAVAQHRNRPLLLARRSAELRAVEHVTRDAFRENQSLEQGIRRQPVRPVYTGARNFAARVQALETRATTQIGDDAPHHVMRRRRHWNQIARRIDATRSTDGEDSGKALLEILTQRPRVEKNPSAPCLLTEN